MSISMAGNVRITTTQHERGNSKGSPHAGFQIGPSQEYLDITNLKINKLVLFGAGASAGCGRIYPSTPPTGKQLFLKLAEAFPDTWGELPKNLKIIFQKDFEDGLDELWYKHTEIYADLMKEFGLYLIPFSPKDGNTLYKAILIHLKDKQRSDILLATLNYDCLLDGEFTRCGIEYNYLFPPYRGTPLLKLHGSCNWYVDIPSVNKYVVFSPTIDINAPIKALHNVKAALEHFKGDHPFPPVMCLYTKEKPAPIGTNFFKHLHNQWKSLVLNAKQIYIIGVQPYPIDKHIWGPLANTKAEIYYIGNEEKYKKWSLDSGRESNPIFISNRFIRGIDKLLELL